MKKPAIAKALSIILALLVWQAAAAFVGMELLLASPWKVALRLISIWREPGFISTIAFTLLRISLGFGIAFLAGLILAIAAGRYRLIDYLLWPYIVTFKSVPVASFIILCLIWFSFRQLTVFITFLIAFPVIYSNVLQGIRSTDAKLCEMADLFRVPWHRRLLYLYLPAIKPYLLSASAVSIGMAWKAGVAAEVIGVVDGSIGERLYEAKVYFMTADLFAWTITIILLSVLLEKVFLYLLKQAFDGVEKL